MMMCVLQDVVRSWYSRLPSMVQNAQQLVCNSEECARACVDGETLQWDISYISQNAVCPTSVGFRKAK